MMTETCFHDLARRLGAFALLLLLLAATPLRGELNNPTSEMLWYNARAPYPGILETSFEIIEPRPMAFWLVRVALSNPAIHLVTNKRAEGWGEPMPDHALLKIRTKRQTVGAFMNECRKSEEEGGRGLNVVLAVNASPWGPWQAPYNHKYADNMGCMISDGELVCPANGRWCFCVPKVGKPFLRKIAPLDDVSELWLSLPGFERILDQGEICVADAPADLHPRTAFGLSANRRFLYILVVDGRQKGYSEGASCHELAQLLQLAGASDALNMDGGGSTTLVLWDAKKKTPRMLNTHGRGKEKNGADSKYQRPVANALGVYLSY